MAALTLPEAKAHLNITSASYDDEIQGTIDAAEAILANSVGPLTQQPQRTDRVPGGRQLLLPIAPVVSVASIATTDGATVDLATVTVNGPAGVIYFTDALSGFWQTVYDVTYTAGRVGVPGDLLLAVKEMVRHLWATQRGGATRPSTGGGDQEAPGYLMPYRVQELIEPYRLVNIGAA